MANLGNNVKTALLKGLEALGDAASSIGSSAKQKLNEMHLASRRDELRGEIPALVLKLWKDGVQLPQELTTLLGELNDLEEQLAALKPAPAPVSEAPTQEPDSFDETMEDLGDKVEDAFEAVEDFVETKAEAVRDAVEEKVNEWTGTGKEEDEPSDNG